MIEKHDTIIQITDAILEFDVLNANQKVTRAGIEKTDYSAIADIDAKYQRMYEYKTKNNLKAEYIASITMTR